jgi:Xaa-Pro aminopeptidase
VVRAINARGWATARLGIETDSHYLTVQTYEALRHALPRATLGDFATVLRDQRLRKSPREIEYLRHYYGATHPPRTSDFTRAFVPTAEWVLEPSMVFHMYTGAQGMSFSETVLVTGSGAERLTRLERCLFDR